MTDEAQTNPQAGEIWLASQITQLFGLDTRTTARLLVAAVQRCGGLYDAVAQPLSTGDAWLTAAGAEAVFQMAYDTAHNDGTIPARFATPRQTRDQILAHWRDFLTPRDNECTHDVTHLGVCVACGTGDDSPEDRDVYDGDAVNQAIDAAEALEPGIPDDCPHGSTPDQVCLMGCDAPEETGLTGGELAEEYAANDAQTRRELAAGDDSAIRDDSAEEEEGGDSPEFREDRVADGTERTFPTPAPIREELDRLFTDAWQRSGYTALPVDGMELSHRMFDFQPDSWADPKQYTVADLKRGEIVRFPLLGGEHVVTGIRDGEGERCLTLHRLTGAGISVVKVTRAPDFTDFSLRLDLLYLEAGVPETDVPAAQPDPFQQAFDAADRAFDRAEAALASPYPVTVECGPDGSGVLTDPELKLPRSVAGRIPDAGSFQLLRRTPPLADRSVDLLPTSPFLLLPGHVFRFSPVGKDYVVLAAKGDGPGLDLWYWDTQDGHKRRGYVGPRNGSLWLRTDVRYDEETVSSAHTLDNVRLEPESRSAWDLEDDRPVEHLAMAPAYRGIPVPEVLWPNLDGPEFSWWCRGVRAALDSGTTEDRDDGR